MIDPQLVLFVIQAAVKLGRKLYDVLVDQTVEAPLLLPFGPLAGSIQEAAATEFFDNPRNRPLIMPGGPYEAFADDPTGRLKVYRTIQRLDVALGVGELTPGASVDVVLTLHRFEQHKAGFGPHSPLQRIAGTVVEIGIDYFVANPQALGKDSPARHVISAFLAGIDGIDFAEGEPTDLIGNTLTAALSALGDNSTLVVHDPRISVLLGGVTSALRDDLKGVSLGELQRRGDLFERITSSLLRAGAEAVAGHPDLFVRGDGNAKLAVRNTLAAILGGIRDQENLFSNEALEKLFTIALSAAADNAMLVTKSELLQSAIKTTVTELTSVDGRKLFSGAAVEVVTRAALETVAENSETLLDAADPQHQWVAYAVAAMAQGLASDLGGPGSVKDLFSTAQLVRLTQIVLKEVANDPTRLLDAQGHDPRRTALAQVLGSVAAALGPDPKRLVNGDTLVALIDSTLRVALKNADKLLDLHANDPKTNALFAILAQLAEAAASAGDVRHLLDRDTFLDTARRILPVASANLEPLLGANAPLVKNVMLSVLQLAGGSLQNRINGENLPLLAAGLLRGVLLKDLDLNDANAIAAAADQILRLAA